MSWNEGVSWYRRVGALGLGLTLQPAISSTTKEQRRKKTKKKVPESLRLQRKQEGRARREYLVDSLLFCQPSERKPRPVSLSNKSLQHLEPLARMDESTRVEPTPDSAPAPPRSYVLSSSSLVLSPLQPPRTTAGSRYEHVPTSMRIILQLRAYVTGSKTKTKTKTWTKVNFTSCLQEEGLPAAARGRRLFRVYKRPPSPSLLVTFTFRLFLLFLIR
ncbi:hypothetical protein KQX54_005715 [Cotesia glomerata]|uniref:Uncharacterized protein n=1 Tax=Cotesia glomerata TaxID=32391 RepID=A0AAV7IA16_COTGL|nr:hypothetical protein KQX54_005715 [Cotesia glomerata]